MYNGSFPLSTLKVAPKHHSASHTDKAYVTFLFDDGTSHARRACVDNMWKSIVSLKATGTAFDIVVLVPRNNTLSSMVRSQLQSQGIKVYEIGVVGAALPFEGKVYSKEVAALFRAKLNVLQLRDYSAVLYFDAGTLFLQNCDQLLSVTHQFVAPVGADAPFDGSVFIVQPSQYAFSCVHDVAHSTHFSSSKGWMEFGPIHNWRRIHPDTRALEGSAKHVAPTVNWKFRRASLDIGLLYFYYVCHLDAGFNVDDEHKPRPGSAYQLLPHTAWDAFIKPKPFSQPPSMTWWEWLLS